MLAIWWYGCFASLGKKWTVAETETFYRGLRAFGLDFDMISRILLKERSHLMIKVNLNNLHWPSSSWLVLVGPPPARSAACPRVECCVLSPHSDTLTVGRRRPKLRFVCTLRPTLTLTPHPRAVPPAAVLQKKYLREDKANTALIDEALKPKNRILLDAQGVEHPIPTKT